MRTVFRLVHNFLGCVYLHSLMPACVFFCIQSAYKVPTRHRGHHLGVYQINNVASFDKYPIIMCIPQLAPWQNNRMHVPRRGESIKLIEKWLEAGISHGQRKSMRKPAWNFENSLTINCEANNAQYLIMCLGVMYLMRPTNWLQKQTKSNQMQMTIIAPCTFPADWQFQIEISYGL